MKKIWKLQDAKNKSSKVVRDALSSGPQYVTRRGLETVVVLSVKDYESLISGKKPFNKFLLSCPEMDDDFEVRRQKDYPRSIDL